MRTFPGLLAAVLLAASFSLFFSTVSANLALQKNISISSIEKENFQPQAFLSKQAEKQEPEKPPVLEQKTPKEPEAENKTTVLEKHAKPPSVPTTAGEKEKQKTVSEQKKETLEFSVEFNQPVFSKQGDYDLLSIKNTGFMSEEGKPMLPEKTVYVAIPPGSELVGLEIVSLQQQVLEGQYDVLPAQVEQPLNETEKVFTEPDEATYSSSNAYPSEVFEEKGVSGVGNSRVVGLAIRPLQYLPLEKKLLFSEKIVFRLSYIRGNLPFSSKKTNHLEHVLEKMVLNPGQQSSGDFAEDYSVPFGTNCPGLSWTEPSVDYLIITSDSLAAYFEPLLEWKLRKGLVAKIATVSQIQSTYGCSGSDTAEQIRNFVKDAYNDYGVEWLLLGADTSIIADRKMYSGADPYGGDLLTPADIYYSALDGDFNADGDSYWGEDTDDTDFVPELFVGRAPVDTAAEAQSFVNKVLLYEKNPPTDYSEKVLFAAEYLDTYTDGGLAKDIIESSYLPTSFSVTKLYENYSNESPSSVVSHLNQGYGLVNHNGHANYYIMGVGTGYLYNSDFDSLTNSPRLSFMYSIGCWAAAIDYDAIAEHFVNNPNGGGFFIGNSRYGWYYQGMPGSGTSDLYDQEFFNSLFSEGFHHVGEALTDSKLAFLSQVVSGGESSSRRRVYWALNLLGDPEASIYTQNPQTMTVTHPSVISLGASQFVATVEDSASQPVEGAVVAVSRSNGLLFSAQTDASGAATFSITFSTPGEINITVTSHNFLPYEAAVQTISEDHDLAVLQLSLSEPFKATDPAQLNATVSNIGASTETSTVRFYIDGSENQSTGIVLDSSESQVVSFAFTPTETKTYTLSVYVDPVALETRVSDNSLEIEEEALPKIHDLKLSSLVFSPQNPEPMNTLYINATASNTGDFTETTTARLYVDSVEQDSQEVVLSRYGETNASFTYTPTENKTYLINFSLDPVVGETNMSDNSLSTNVSVYAAYYALTGDYSEGTESSGGFVFGNVLIRGKDGNFSNQTTFNSQQPELRFDFQFWNPESCPACIQQLLVMGDWGEIMCVQSDLPGTYPGDSGSQTITFPVPQDLNGTHRIVVGETLLYDCGEAVQYAQDNQMYLNDKAIALFSYDDILSERQDFEVHSLNVSQNILHNIPFETTAEVYNNYSYEAYTTVRMFVNGSQASSESVSLSSSESATLSFTHSLTQGNWLISVRADNGLGETDVSDNTVLTYIFVDYKDLAVENLQVPSNLSENQVFQLNATITNNGTASETSTARFFADQVEQDTSAIILPPGESTTVSFTTSFSQGLHEVNITVDQVANESDTGNNWKHSFVSVNYHNLVATGLSTPPLMVWGKSYGITATVSNQGDTAETSIVRLYANTTLLETQTVSLPQSSQSTVVFNQSFPTGPVFLNATIDPAAGEENMQDNWFGKQAYVHHRNLFVSEPLVPDPLYENQTFGLLAFVSNNGTVWENSTLRLVVDGFEQVSQPVSLQPATMGTFTFTAAFPRGQRVINTVVDPVEDEDNLGDNEFEKQVNVEHRDFSVTQLNSPLEVFENEVVWINATVSNNGSLSENATARFFVNQIEQSVAQITLSSQASTTVSFTTSFGVGLHQVNVSVDQLTFETNTDNNWKNTTVSVDYHDVAVVNVSAPSKMSEGKTYELNVTVANHGNQTESSVVRLFSNGSEIGNKEIVLGQLSQETLVFEAVFSQGLYVVNATIDPVLGEQEFSDNWLTTEILVDYHNLFVSEPLVPQPVYENQQFEVVSFFSNNGTVWENSTLRLIVGGVEQENAQLSLPPGSSDSFTHTLSLPRGPYGLESKIDPVEDEDNLGDNVFQKQVQIQHRDLEMGPISVSPEIVYAGQTFYGEALLFNRGSLAENATTRLYIDSVEAGSQVFEIPAGGSQTVTFSGSLQAGEHEFNISVDELEYESGEHANWQTLTITSDSRDLVVDSITLNPQEPYASQPTSVVVGIFNNGSRSETSVLELLVNGATVQNQVVSLGPGQGSTATFTQTFEPGSHNVSAYWRELEYENATGNNAVSTILLAHKRDTVLAQLLSLTPHPVAGEAVFFNATVLNNGTRQENATIRVFCEETEKEFFETTLAPLEQQVFSLNCSFSDGDHWLNASIDPLEYEENRSNNWKAESFYVDGPPVFGQYETSGYFVEEEFAIDFSVSDDFGVMSVSAYLSGPNQENGQLEVFFADPYYRVDFVPNYTGFYYLSLEAEDYFGNSAEKQVRIEPRPHSFALSTSAAATATRSQGETEIFEFSVENLDPLQDQVLLVFRIGGESVQKNLSFAPGEIKNETFSHFFSETGTHVVSAELSRSHVSGYTSVLLKREVGAESEQETSTQTQEDSGSQSSVWRSSGYRISPTVSASDATVPPQPAAQTATQTQTLQQEPANNTTVAADANETLLGQNETEENQEVDETLIRLSTSGVSKTTFFESDYVLAETGGGENILSLPDSEYDLLIESAVADFMINGAEVENMGFSVSEETIMVSEQQETLLSFLVETNASFDSAEVYIPKPEGVENFLVYYCHDYDAVEQECGRDWRVLGYEVVSGEIKVEVDEFSAFVLVEQEEQIEIKADVDADETGGVTVARVNVEIEYSKELELEKEDFDFHAGTEKPEISEFECSENECEFYVVFEKNVEKQEWVLELILDEAYARDTGEIRHRGFEAENELEIDLDSEKGVLEITLEYKSSVPVDLATVSVKVYEQDVLLGGFSSELSNKDQVTQRLDLSYLPAGTHVLEIVAEIDSSVFGKTIKREEEKIKNPAQQQTYPETSVFEQEEQEEKEEAAEAASAISGRLTKADFSERSVMLAPLFLLILVVFFKIV